MSTSPKRAVSFAASPSEDAVKAPTDLPDQPTPKQSPKSSPVNSPTTTTSSSAETTTAATAVVSSEPPAESTGNAQEKDGVDSAAPSAEKEPTDRPETPPMRASALKMQKTSAPKSVFCDHCKDQIPIEEWPNHRDRLRTVKISDQARSALDKYVLTPAMSFIMWVLANVFFREVAVVGSENIPATGPVIFYGNHQNQFMDAIMIRAHCDRAPRFIIAEKSLSKPIIGHFARLLNAVPVVRPQDVPSTPGVGKLVLTESNVVTGEGTDFTKGINEGDVISWTTPHKKERSTGQVIAVDSPTRLRLSLPVKESDAITAEPTAFKISRRIDHSEMYAKVYGTLGSNQCIGIFPEGGSHDRTSLLPLKAGVALFTLGACERGIIPKIVPCGLTYFYGHKFRSRAHLEFGKPFTAPAELVNLFGTDKRAATAKMLDLLGERLREVTINTPDWETLKFLHSFRRLYQPAQMMLDTGDYLRLTRRLAVIITEQENSAEFADFRQNVENYGEFCNALLVRDAQVATLVHFKDKDNATIMAILFRRVVILSVLALVLVPFVVVCGPIGIIAHVTAEAQARSALAGSKVKLVGADVKASHKIVLGFVLVPIIFNICSIIVHYYTDFRTAFTVFLCLPMAMYVSLFLMRDFVMEGRAALPLFMSVLNRHKQFMKLHERREKLVAQAKEIVHRYDPDLETELKAYEEDSQRHRSSLFSLRHRSTANSKKLR